MFENLVWFCRRVGDAAVFLTVGLMVFAYRHSGPFPMVLVMLAFFVGGCGAIRGTEKYQ